MNNILYYIISYYIILYYIIGMYTLTVTQTFLCPYYIVILRLVLHNPLWKNAKPQNWNETTRG